MQVVTPDELEGREKKEYETEDGLSVVTDYFGGAEANNEEPSAFLVEYRPLPGAAIRPHFHKIAQFQVVIGGDGRIGKQPVPPISFQYADPSTPYGPIAPSDEQRGIDFLTLRPVARGGIWWMPGSRHEMSGRAGRNVAATVSPDEPLPTTGSQIAELIDPDHDGLAGYLLRLAPHAHHEITVPPDSAGHYHLITRGTLTHDERTLERMTLLFVHPNETITHTAGPHGGEVLIMQFPHTIEPTQP